MIVSPFVMTVGICAAGDWPQYRGPNGSGVGDATHLPTTFGPEENVVWKTPVPFGHSSPVIAGNLIFITAEEGATRSYISDGNYGRPSVEKVVYKGGKLYTLALDRLTGKIVWRKEAPRTGVSQLQENNSPATPSAATDGKGVFVFFQDFGLLAYNNDGAERWRLPLGPFNNMNGAGSSPILYGDLVVMICDQDSADSFLIAVEKNTGKVRWKTPRPESTRSYSTPGVLKPKGAPAEIIVPGPYQATAYFADTGEKSWWVRGLSWQPKSVPVIDGDIIYALAADNGNLEKQEGLPSFAELRSKYDADHDGKLTPKELAGDPAMRKIAPAIDMARKGYFDERDWGYYLSKMEAGNNLIAIRDGGHGDVTESNVLWSTQKYLPCCTSPLLYQGVLYFVKEGGILTALDPKTGSVPKQGRLKGALDEYYSSPVAAANKVYLLSRQGKLTVLKAGADWEILAVNNLDDESFATPAIVDNKIYVRTHGMMYCFADKE